MFNSVNGNPFGQKIESALSAGQDKKQEQQNPQKDDEKRYLEDDDQDEVQIGTLPELSEDDVSYLVQNYIAKLKSEHEGEEKIISKLDKFLSKFDVKKFMKQNPHMTASDFHMVMYNETSGLLN